MLVLNRVTFIGRLTADPDPPKRLKNDSRVIRFPFVVNKIPRKDTNGKYLPDPNPMYIDCEAFTNPTDRYQLVDIIAEYCARGQQLYIEGELTFKQWQDKKGQPRSKHILTVKHIQMFETERKRKGKSEIRRHPGQDAGLTVVYMSSQST